MFKLRPLDNLKYLYKATPSNRFKYVVENVWNMMPESIRFGIEYQKMLNFLRRSEEWDEDKLINYQIQELRKILFHAISTVPYYKEKSKDWGISFDKIRDVSLLKQIPIMTKEIMRVDTDRFLSNKYNKNKLIHATTGGSSGETFHFYKTDESSSKEWAFITCLWSRVGFSNSDWRIVLRGPIAGEHSKGIYWVRKPKNRELILSTYHMNDENMYKYLEIIKESGYKYLHCHPSSGYIFANFLSRNNLTCSLKAVLAASEAVYPFQRKVMEEVFQCRVYTFYGQSEQVCLAGECEQNEVYHIQPEYGLTEILDAMGNNIENEDELGEIVSTGFINDAMPFIRYRTGDLAVFSKQKCMCGRNHKIIKRIEGRDYEYIVTKDGRVISLTGLIHGQHFQAFSRIKKMQIYQKRKGEIEIRIAKYPEFSKKDEMEIANSIIKCVAHGIEIKFKYLDDIQLSSRGKHKLLIQEVRLDFLENLKDGKNDYSK